MKMDRTLPIRMFVTLSLLCVVLVDEMAGDQLQATLSTYQSRILVGEPLVVTVAVTNIGQDKVKTPYYQSRVLSDASMGFTIARGTEKILLVSGGGSGAKVLMLSDRFMGAPGVPDFSIPPGRSVRAKKTIPLLLKAESGSLKHLEPGKYTVKASVQLTVKKDSDLSWVSLETPEYEFSIEAQEESYSSALSLLASIPSLDLLLQGRCGKATNEMLDLGSRLKQQYPQWPLLKYVDARFLQNRLQFPGNDNLGSYEAAVVDYLGRHPDSPFKDDLLFYLGCLQEIKKPEAVEGITSVIATFERILKECPDSPLTEEVEAKLTKLRRLLAEAAAPSE